MKRSAKDPRAAFWNERPFIMAVAISLSWHFFWFFSVTITVTAPNKKARPRPEMVSLGPVLDDSFFKTLVQTKPQFSETIYRQPVDFGPALEAKAQTLEKREAGEVVSMPFGKNFVESMKNALGGDKSAPAEDFFGALSRSVGRIPLVEGDAKGRRVLSRPVEPAKRNARSMKNSSLEMEFVVLPSGEVAQVSVVQSTGNARTDLEWIDYLRHWRFESLPDKRGPEVHGKVTFDVGEAP